MAGQGSQKQSQRINTRSTSAEFDFTAAFRSFLSDEENVWLLRDSITTPLLDEIQRLTTVISQKYETIQSLKQEVGDMAIKMDELKQYTRRNSVRISGVPETEGESCESIVLKLANETLHLDPPLELNDIDRTHRVGRPNGDRTSPRSIILKFGTYRQRRRMMNARSKLSNHSPKIFINEDLTNMRATLCFHARRMKRDGYIKDVKTFDGRVVITPNQGPSVTVRSLDELQKHRPTESN